MLTNFFQVHICDSSSVPDHCLAFALSDPRDPHFQKPCIGHQHDQICDRCSTIPFVLKDLREALGNSPNISVDDRDGIMFDIDQAEQSIQAWKAHLLRTCNQDKARLKVLEELDANSVLLIQDWAMKYLPRKFRESQTDWFAKRGLSWHVTVAIRKVPELQMMTFVHLFQSCAQDSVSVMAIMDDVFKELKSVMPNLLTVFYRQDNAGCYHSGLSIVSAKLAADRNGVILKRMDFSDPQGGKGPCDRKAANIKTHINVHVNSGNDVETAEDMKNAIQSSNGIPGVRVFLCDPPNLSTADVNWNGVSLVNNIMYEESGIRVWRAYGVGPGKLLPWRKFNVPNPDELPSLTIRDDANNERAVFTAVKPRRQASTKPDQQQHLPTSHPSVDVQDASYLFACPEEGCTKSYQFYSGLQAHLDCGKHVRALEHETLLDRAMVGYGMLLEAGSSTAPQFEETGECPGDIGSVSVPPLSRGWALKSTSSRTRFTATQKEYLVEVFKAGEASGRKVDPAAVAKAMRTAKNATGDRLLTRREFLTTKQIASYFSRLSSKKRLNTATDSVADDDNEDTEAMTIETAIQATSQMVVEEVAQRHPVLYDRYNLCELSSQGKLKIKFSVKMLQAICDSFELTASGKQKKPYVEAIDAMLQHCSCRIGF